MFSSQAQSTMMSILNQATGPDDQLRRSAIDRFCQVYSRPLVLFLVKTKQITEEESEDVVQSFLHRKLFSDDAKSSLIESYLSKKKDHPNLSFRRYLARSVSNHFLDLKRKQSHEHTVEEMSWLFDSTPTEVASEFDVFDIAWANHILFRVLESVRLECVKKNQLEMWQLFDEYFLRPSLAGIEVPGYAELARRFALHDPKTVSNRIQTMLRKFRRLIEESVIDYLPGADDQSESEAVALEISRLLAILCRPGSLRIVAQSSVESDFSIAYSLSMEDENQARWEMHDKPQLLLFRSDLDKRAAWNHLIRMPLSHWLLRIDDPESDRSLMDVVSGRAITVSLCDCVRSRAKMAGSGQGLEQVGELPGEYYRAVYLLAVVGAQRNLGQRISTHSPEELMRRCERTADESWLDEQSAYLLRSHGMQNASGN